MRFNLKFKIFVLCTKILIYKFIISDISITNHAARP